MAATLSVFLWSIVLGHASNRVGIRPLLIGYACGASGLLLYNFLQSLHEFSNRTGGLECDFTNTNAIVVTRPSVPIMSVTITRHADGIDVSGQIASEGGDPSETREHLALRSDARSTSFLNDAGEQLTVDQTVYYILRRFLYPGARINRSTGFISLT